METPQVELPNQGLQFCGRGASGDPGGAGGD